MIEPKLALKVVKEGTHYVKILEINDDVPSPAECVAEALTDLEFSLAELVKVGGAINNPEAYHYAKKSLLGLNLALNAASKQNWELELEQNPEKKVECALFGPAILPVEGCTCKNCEEVRQYGPVNSKPWCAHRRELRKIKT